MKSFYELKVVNTRKDHPCTYCSENIQKGNNALVENGFNKEEGFFNHYFHRTEQCAKGYIDVQMPEDTVVTKLLNLDFKGQIFYKRWKE